jgi:two-component system, NtrC family, sensor kinase
LARAKRAACEQSSRERYDLTFKRSDGSPLHTIVSASPLCNGDGGSPEILEMITERTLVQEQLCNSEALYHSLVENLPQNIFRKDLEGRFTFVNQRFCLNTGIEADEILGKTDFAFYPAELAVKYRDDDREVIRSEKIVEMVEEHQSPGNAQTYVRVIKSPLHDSHGRVIGVQGIFWDITEGKRTADQLRKLSHAVEQSPVSVIITDLNGNIEYVNKKFVEVTGYGLEEVIGQNPRILKSGKTAPEVYERLWKTITAGHEWRGEFQNKKKNGELLWEAQTLSPIRDESGNITHFLAMKEDITERKQVEQERAIMEIQLQQALKLEAVGRLAAGIAHEINTPTQYVSDNTRFLEWSFVELLKVIQAFEALFRTSKQGRPSPEQIAYVESACEQADVNYLSEEIPKAITQSLEGLGRVAAIVKAMKEFSHPSSEEKQSVDLNHLIDSTLTITRNEWKYVADVVRDFDRGLPPVPCLPGEFNQVILNLVVNAAHAIADVVDQGRNGKGVITVSTRKEGPWAVVRVEDTGGGIADAIREKIFEPFFTTKEVGKGTGQGLTIARSVIVGKHGGKIDFESTTGKGTTFIIHLPLG